MTIGTQDPEEIGNGTLYTNTSTDDNEVVIQTGDVSRWNTFMVMSLTGAVDVFVSLDGTNYATAALSLVDQGAADAAPVLVTAALRCYGFRGIFRKIRVLQNGATGVSAVLLCGSLG